MKINTASYVLQPHVVRQAATAIASGETVSIPEPSDREVDAISRALDTSELVSQVSSGLAAVPSVKLDPTSQQALAAATASWSPEQRALIGAGSGVVLGAGIGLCLDQLRMVAPKTSLVFELACSAIGGALGLGIGANIFEVELERDEKGALSAKLRGVKP